MTVERTTLDYETRHSYKMTYGVTNDVEHRRDGSVRHINHKKKAVVPPKHSAFKNSFICFVYIY